jgi:ABC-type phosphate/phosphonate transport system substrate-binding protein
VTAAIASLPMYDWPEVRPATDRFWRLLRDALCAEGIAAPEGLDRGHGLHATWTDPGLVLAQCCGLPFVRMLAGRVELIGAPDYGLPGCPPGFYRSAIVVRRDDPRETLDSFRAARLAFNERGSQSGHAAMLHHVAPLARDLRFFSAAVETGSHAASAALVAARGADIAALDMVSWRLVEMFRADARELRVLLLTDPTPGLPFIAARGADVAGMRRAIAAAVAALDGAARRDLGLVGFRPFDPPDYAVIRDRAETAERLVAI